METKDGWYWPINSRKDHYFKSGDSLCRKYRLVQGMQAYAGDEPADPCAECKRRHGTMEANEEKLEKIEAAWRRVLDSDSPRVAVDLLLCAMIDAFGPVGVETIRRINDGIWGRDR